MWDTVLHSPGAYSPTGHLSHDLPCSHCGHAIHTFLACGDRCDCPPVVMPGVQAA